MMSVLCREEKFTEVENSSQKGMEKKRGSRNKQGFKERQALLFCLVTSTEARVHLWKNWITDNKHRLVAKHRCTFYPLDFFSRDLRHTTHIYINNLCGHLYLKQQILIWELNTELYCAHVKARIFLLVFRFLQLLQTTDLARRYLLCFDSQPIYLMKEPYLYLCNWIT